MSTNPYHYSFNLLTNGTFNHKPHQDLKPKVYKQQYAYPKYPQQKSAYHCESCDREFWNKTVYQQHLSEHVTCNRDGCTFTAHSKIVLNHIRMQHDTGLYKRISNLQNDEAIKAWIAERKRRYPTMKNIEDKKQIEQEKEKRGERIKLDNYKFNATFKPRQRDKRHHNKLFKTKMRFQSHKRNKVKGLKVVDVLKQEEQQTESVIPKFCGTRSLTENKITDIEEGEVMDFSDEENFSKPAVPLVNNSLGLLMTSYNSSDSDEPPEEVKNEKPNEPCVESDEVKVDVEKKAEKKTRPIRRKHNNAAVADVPPKKRRPTLLEMLLRKEIVHERNVILQCIRYIVKNNFFEKAN